MAPMIRSLVTACCAASGVQAAGVEDSLALLQVGTEAHAGGAPVLMMSRSIDTEKGSSMDFHFAPGCSSKDDHGDNMCEVPWNTQVLFNSSAHLKAPIRRGDTVSFQMSSKAKVGSGAPELLQAAMSGQKMQGGFTCGICSGSCKMTASSDSGFRSIVTMPSMLSAPEACSQLDAVMPTSIPLGQFEMKTPEAPDRTWGMQSMMEVTLGLLDSAGAPRVSETIQFKLTPPGAEKASLLSTGAASLAGVVGAVSNLERASASMSAVAEQMQGARQGSLSLLGLIKETAAGATLASLARAAPLLGSKPKQGTPNIDALTLKVTITDPENPAGVEPIALTAEQSCIRNRCKIPLGRHTTLSGKMNMRYTLTEGSFAKIKMKPEIGGMMGAMIKPMLMPITSAFPLKVPACGDRPVNITFMGQKSTMTPPPCGEYTFDIEAPATPVSLPDIGSMTFAKMGLPKMPMMPDRLADLPSFTMAVSVDVFHKDGSPLVGLEAEYGAGH